MHRRVRLMTMNELPVTPESTDNPGFSTPGTGAGMSTEKHRNQLFERIMDKLNLAAQLTDTELAEYQSPQLVEDVTLPPGFVVSIVIPVFNEASTIAAVIGRVAALPLPKQIVIVDDASTDGTREILEQLTNVDKKEIGR